jgi:hypothetical protein
MMPGRRPWGALPGRAPRRPGQGLRLALILAAAAGLGACATLPGTAPGVAATPAPAEDAGRGLPAPVSAFLAEAAPGATRRFDQTPWGEAELQVGALFFAASGRHCRPLQVQGAGAGARSLLACALPGGGWEARHAVAPAGAR